MPFLYLDFLHIFLFIGFCCFLAQLNYR